VTSDPDSDLDALPYAALLVAAKSVRRAIRYRLSLDRQLADAPRTSREFGG
jgi:hypothetical protein